MGLGHAVLCAQHLIGDEPFAVILGDEIIDAQVPALGQLIHVYKKRHGAVLGVQEVPKQDVGRYGIVTPTKLGKGLHRVDDLVERVLTLPSDARLRALGRQLAAVPTPDEGPLEAIELHVWATRFDADTLAPLSARIRFLTVRFDEHR